MPFGLINGLLSKSFIKKLSQEDFTQRILKWNHWQDNQSFIMSLIPKINSNQWKK